MDKRILLIDGHSILNRAFYGIPPLTNSDGLHTNAIYGFINILFKILDEEKAEYLTVAFDVSAPTFRHDMYAEYKGTRKGMPDELREQVPIMKEILKAMNITILELPGFEADDIIGTIAKKCEKEGFKISIVSGDRDLLQLATDNIKIRIPKTKMSGTEIEDYYAKDVVDKYEVTPEEFIDVKGLMGDPSDNIPGVPGIGEKTAIKLIKEFNSIENIYENIDKVTAKRANESLKANHEIALLSKKLATINTTCEFDYDINLCKMNDVFNEKVYTWFKKLEYKTLLSRFNFDFEHKSAEQEHFACIYSIEEADKVFEKANNKGIIGLQLITENQILGLALSFSDEDIYFIKITDEITESYLIENTLRLYNSDKIISTLNLKDQLKYLNVIQRKDIFDVSVAGYLLNPIKDAYHYDDIAKDYLEMVVPSKEDLLGKGSLDMLASIKEAEFIKYACFTGLICYKSYEPLSDRLEQTSMLNLFNDIEMPLTYVLHDMEIYGIRVNSSALKEYGDMLNTRIIELEKEIHDLSGVVFNINSPKQLGEVLFEKLGLPNGKKTKTGYSTASDVLEKLMNEHIIIKLIIEYRQLTKLKSTYADGLANYIAEDSRIHGKFNQTITATGRISSTEPNLQNIPIRLELGRKIRKVFVPEEDYVFVDADYSQIELRVLAHISNDEILVNAYKEDLDIHRITASQVFHTPLSEVTPLQRSNAKAVNFGIVYGISSFGLSQDLSITRKEADRYIKQYFQTYPRVKEFLDEVVDEAKDRGYAETMFGRRRPIPELRSSNFMQRSFGERIAMNSPIQGTAADIIKIAMIRVSNKLKELNLRSRLILQVHDELLIETHKDEVEIVKSILISEMQYAVELKVPLEIDVNIGDTWYDTK